MDSAGKASGYVQLIPGLQATIKAPVEVYSRYQHSGGNSTVFEGVCALSTPVNAAITQIQFLAIAVNTTAGTFILKSRPLVPTL